MAGLGRQLLISSPKLYLIRRKVKMARQRLVNFICVVLVAAIAAGLCWYVIPNWVELPRFRFGTVSSLVTPRLVPTLSAVLLLVASGAHLLILILKPESDEAQAPIETWPGSAQRRSLVAVSLVALYILVAIESLGFYTATALALALGFYLLGERSALRIVVIPVLASTVFYLLFERLFNMFLPRGLFF